MLKGIGVRGDGTWNQNLLQDQAALADIMGHILNFNAAQLGSLLTCVRDTLNALSRT